MFAVWSSPNKKVPAYLEMGLEDRMSFVVSHLKWNFGEAEQQSAQEEEEKSLLGSSGVRFNLVAPPRSNQLGAAVHKILAVKGNYLTSSGFFVGWVLLASRWFLLQS